jgi:hypothetical protein
MPALSDLTQEQWTECKQAAIAGVTFAKLGEAYGMEPSSIKQRAWREQWPTPARVASLKEQALANLPASQKALLPNVDGSPQTAELVAESIAEKGQKGASMVVNGLLSVIERTFRENSPLMLKEIESHKEAASMFGIFAKASGLDKPQQAVQINMWGQASGTVSGPDMPLDCTQIDSDASDGS